MVIETDARRFIVDSIKYDKLMTDFERQSKKQGLVILASNKDYNVLRAMLLTKMCEINSIANSEGKGRDDFKIEVLIKAEDLLKKASTN